MVGSHSSPVVPAASVGRSASSWPRPGDESRSPTSRPCEPTRRWRRSERLVARRWPSTIDITDAESVDRGCRHVEDEFGPIEILVNVAGWDRFMKFVDTDEDFWDRIIDINFKGMLRTTHRCVPAMIDAGWGRIVNIASDAGPRRVVARGGLLRRKGWNDRVHEDPGTRGRAPRDHCQRRVPGSDRHPAAQRDRGRESGQRSSSGSDGQCGADEAGGSSGRSCFRCRLLRLGRSEFHDRTDAVGVRRSHDGVMPRSSAVGQSSNARPAYCSASDACSSCDPAR